MKYIKETLNYIIKNFLFLFVFALLPAVGHAFLRDNKTYLDFFLVVDKGKTPVFADVYRNFSMILTDHSWLSIITVVVYLLTIPLALAMIEKHMRIGKKSFSGLFSRLNYNILSTTLLIGLFLIIYEIWSVVLSALIVLAGLIGGAASYILISLVIIAMYVVILYIVTPFFVWLPCVLVTGYKYSEGFVESFRLIDRKKNGIALAIAFPLVVFNIIQIILKVCFGKVFVPVKFVIYVLYFVYYAALCFVVYFDLTDTERMDKKRKYY